jgi:hypothetical protein
MIKKYLNDDVLYRIAKPNFREVIHMAFSSIHMWSYLLPTDQREPVDIECNHLMTVV